MDDAPRLPPESARLQGCGPRQVATAAAKKGGPGSGGCARAGLVLASLLAVASADHRAAAQQPAEVATATIAELAKQSGEPQIPGLRIVYLHPLGNPADARHWKYIIAHQTEGPAGSAHAMAQQQFKTPTKRGVTIWVETDGTVYWSAAETAIPNHGDGANRNDNKYVDNSKTYRIVVKSNSLGVEFVGNHPDVRKPVTDEQMKAWLALLPFLQERYGIPPENVYAHNWIDFKDQRYCEGCELGNAARKLGYVPGRSAAAAGDVP